jgi:sigma-E factor negative regulatory protein RseC
MNGIGTITSISGNKARIKMETGSECSGCAAKGHCHSAGNEGRELSVINEIGAHTGDRVYFEAHSGKVLLSAALVWILPIVAMIIGYEAASRFAGGIVPILAAFAFLAGSFVVLRTIDNAIAGGTSFYPRISRVLKKDAACHQD